MATERTSEKASRSGQNRIFVLLLVFAAISSAGKDLDRLHFLTQSIHSVTNELMQMGATAYASEIEPVTLSCPAIAQAQKTEEFRWAGQIASGQAIEIKGINGGITAEPASGGEVEVLAMKKARYSDPASVNIKVVPHASGVTICAVYPRDLVGDGNGCEPGKVARTEHRDPPATMNVRPNDVSVDFRVKVPTGVSLIGRTINGEISARTLSGNVDSQTVNGSIDVSTSGYAQAKTVNGTITAKIGRADWHNALEFRTVNGGIDLDFPPSLSTRIEAETFNGGITSDFPLAVLGRISRKHLNGTIGQGGRELLLKTLNGSIRVRRVS